MDKDTFAMVCYLELMSNIKTKHPTYIMEKTKLLWKGYDAFAHLDINHMRNVMKYLKKWKMEIPEPITKEFELQETGHEALLAKGIEL